MSLASGSVSRPVRVAIIGAGPAGFYAAGELLKQKQLEITVDLFDRLPTPYGLVRYGVAPDHQKIKSVVKIFARTAALAGFRFFGHVNFGTDITHEDLRMHYDQIVYAVGAQTDRNLNIPGEDLPNSLSATEFVAWYNGHPDYVDLQPNLQVKSAVVVGAGNVALDVARILAKSPEELQETDIADHALAALAKSEIQDIYIVARRGPAQAKFTSPELREFGQLAIADTFVNHEELLLDPASAEHSASSTVQKNLAILADFVAQKETTKSRRVHFYFYRSPVEILGEAGQIVAVRTEKNELQADESGYLKAVGTGDCEDVPAGLILRSIGYRGVPLPGVPYDTRRGIIPNCDGRVWDPEVDKIIAGEYVVGWAKRGPSGVIGTNKPDAAATVAKMLEDMSRLEEVPQADSSAIVDLLEARAVRFVTFDEWTILDQEEIAAGNKQRRPRVKFTAISEMLVWLDG